MPDYIEFVHDGVYYGKPPPQQPNLPRMPKLLDLKGYEWPRFADMQDYVFGHLEGLEVVVIKGPLKGHMGMIKTVGITGIAHVELRTSYMQAKGLQLVKIQHLAYEV